MRTTPHLVLTCALAAAIDCNVAHAMSLFGSRTDVVEVGVREVPADDLWQVSYHLPFRAAGIELPRGRGTFRRDAWSVVPATSTWVDAEDGERLCFARPTRDFAVSFRSDTVPRVKDHAVHLAMSDGGRLLYTGHLVVRPLESCAAGPATTEASDRELVHRFRLSTESGRTVRVLELAAEGALTWRPPAGKEATYAYFGPQAPAPGERIGLVADPALPSWLRKDLETSVATLLDRFAAETALALPVRPLVLLSFDGHGSGRGFQGGVVGGVVQLAAVGEGWLTESTEGRRMWTLRLARELFHLWDEALLHPDGESEWLSEAAAEAFALRAAYGLGVIDARQLAERLVDLGNQCLAGLDGGALISAPDRRRWDTSKGGDTWYTCGPVLLFVAGQAVEKARPGEGGLGLLAREMLAEAQAAGGVYGTGTFLGWLDKLSGDRATVLALQGWIRRGVPRGADRFLAQQLSAAGYRVTLAPPAEAGASSEVFGTLLGTGLTRCACGPAGLEASPEVAAPEGDCALLAGGSRPQRVDDVEVRRDPAAAYSRFRTAAGLGRPLRVVAGDGGQPLTLFCGRDSLDPSFDQLLRLE